MNNQNEGAMTIITLDDQINQELQKENITEKIISELKKNYMVLKINGLDDKEGYIAVKNARKECKQLRVTASKICKKGREEAAEIQKTWIKTEKDVTGRISEVEDYLEKQEKDYEAEKERIDSENKRKLDAQFISRSAIIVGYGAKLTETGFLELNNVSYDTTLIREVDEEIWDSEIMPKYKSIFDELERVRIDNEEKLQRMAQMETTVFNARKSELLDISIFGETIYYESKEVTNKAELVKMDDVEFASFKIDHNKVVESDRTEARKKQELKDRTEARKKQLYSIDLKFDGSNYSLNEIQVSEEQLIHSDAEVWETILSEVNKKIEADAAFKKQEADRKQQEIKAQAEKEALGKSRKSILEILGINKLAKELSEMEESIWLPFLEESKKLHEQEVQRKNEISQKEIDDKKKAEYQEELSKASDKQKWDVFIKSLSELQLPIGFTTKKYNTLLAIAKEKIEEISELNKR